MKDYVHKNIVACNLVALVTLWNHKALCHGDCFILMKRLNCIVSHACGIVTL